MTYDLAKLKKLEAKASPAPWWQDDIDGEDGHGHYKAYCVGYDTKAILDTSNSDVIIIDYDEDGPRFDTQGYSDTAFIAEMRNAAPAMIARIEKLEAALKRIKYELSVPAAEYVPAIRDVFGIVDEALK